MRKPREPDDRSVELLIGTLLRIGVIIAALIVATGGVFYLSHRAQAIPHYGVFQGSRPSWSGRAAS